MNAKLNAAIDCINELGNVSPYELAKIASAVMERKVQGPMLYNYVNKGYIAALKNDTGKWSIEAVDAIAWLVKYSEGKNVGSRKIDSVIDAINSAE